MTFVADYVPLQDPFGGPNYYELDPNALYMIHINNDGSGTPNLTFRFAFQNSLLDNKFVVGGKPVSIPFVINGAPINKPFAPGINARETFNISVIRPGSEQAATKLSTGETFFDKPIDNIGNKSIPNYDAYAAQHMYDISVPGCAGAGRVFVGQRKDPFVVNLGQIFDLINIKAPATEFDPNAERAGKDDLALKNVTAIVLELPIACVTGSASPIIGAWTTAAVPGNKTFTATPPQRNLHRRDVVGRLRPGVAPVGPARQRDCHRSQGQG